MDIVRNRRVKNAQGNASAEYSDIIARAQSWSRGADASTQAISAESMEEDLAFGVPNPRKENFERDGTNAQRGGRTDGVQ